MGCFWSVFSCGLLKPVRHVSSSTSLTETNRQTAKKEEGNNSSFNDRSITKVAIRSEDDILQASNLKKFQYSELKAATRNFRPDSLLGEGGFGSVFKGWIDESTLMPSKPGSGIVVAVKKLNLDGLQGHEEWLAEVNYLGQLHHPNLVRLIGYSLENEHRLLVYEFMPRGNLENHLFRRGSSFQPLSWDLRIKIALGSAKGVEFLHDSKPQVIYRDLKTSNILIDSDYNAKLSDFGLAKNGPTDDDTHVTTRVMGTHGYAAPEYLTTGHLTSKSDVYSFGVVLLELFTGKRAIDSNRPTCQLNLVDWALPFLKSKRKVLSILDPRLEAYSSEGAMTTANLTQRCLNVEGKLRPNMNEIVEALEKIQDLKLSTKSSRPLRRNSFPKQH